MGWFPTTLGGLNRYYRSLFEQLPQARGVVVGPADDAPARVSVVDQAQTPLPRRLLDFWLTTRRAVAGTEIADVHFALYAAAPLLLGALRDRPLVFHFHGPWAQENIVAGDSSRVSYLLRMGLERYVLRRAAAYVVLSSAFRRELVERYGVRPWDVHVWSPGVAVERFTPADGAQARERFGVNRDAFVAVCVRRLVSRMGLDVLLDAWEQARGVLSRGSTLLLVGDGPLRDALTERAARASLSGSVRLLGRLSDEDLVEAYRAADVAVVPSVSLEGFGLVVLEAAACGTPSIVSDVGGLPEVTAPLDRSLIVAPTDASALGERIVAAARGQLPTRAATRGFAESHSWPRLAERHQTLYRQLLDGERDARVRVVYLAGLPRRWSGETHPADQARTPDHRESEGWMRSLQTLTGLQNVNPHVILGGDGPIAARLIQAGISVEVLAVAAHAHRSRQRTAHHNGASPLARLRTLRCIVRLTMRLRALRPDIVHADSLSTDLCGVVAARAAGIPIVWQVHSRSDAKRTSRAARLVRIVANRLTDAVIADSLATAGELESAYEHVLVKRGRAASRRQADR